MTAASKPGPIPESYRRVTPCLVVRGAAKALWRGRPSRNPVTGSG
jgi:hypothetical protein